MGGAPQESGGELERFRLALRLYRGLVGEVDEDAATRVEEVELAVAEEVAPEARRAVEEGLGLEGLASRLAGEGVLERVYEMVAEKLGLKASPLEEAYTRLNAGDVEDPSAKALFIALQAVARAYSRILLEVGGVREVRGVQCPVCGVESNVMVSRGGGRYSMICPFCYYEWRLPGEGLQCPRCGSRDPFSLGIYTGRSDRRIALLHCQECGYTARLILDPRVAARAPRSLLPLLALGAEKYRAFMEESG